MTSIGILQILVFFGLILLVTKPVGLFMSRLFQGERTFLHPVLRPIERLVYKLCGVRERIRNSAGRNTPRRSCPSASSPSCSHAPLQRLQGHLPLNPQGFGTAQVPPDLAFNTAISFTTNTNWQAYSGESTLSYLVQMAALAVQNFVSAAAGIAVAIAVIRGFARQETDRIGNFWVDLTRATLYVLMPISIVAALVFCSQGVIQNFHPYTVAKTVEGATQTIAQGPGRVAGGHQATGHEWRRLLQRQLGASLREPDAVHEPRSDPADLRARRGPHLYVRPHGQGHAARAGRCSPRCR